MYFLFDRPSQSAAQLESENKIRPAYIQGSFSNQQAGKRVYHLEKWPKDIVTLQELQRSTARVGEYSD